MNDETRDFETLMRTLGVQRYDGVVAQAKARGDISTTPHGHTLLSHSTALVEDGVKEFLRERKKRMGPTHGAVRFMAQLPTGTLALIATRAVIDGATSSERTEVSYARSIGLLAEHEAHLTVFRREAKALWKELDRQQRRASIDHRRKVFLSAAGRTELSFEPWTSKDRLTLGLVMLDLVIKETGLLKREMYTRKRGARWVTQVVLHPTGEMLEWLDTASDEHAARTPVFLPTPSPPLEWSTNWDGGYHGLNVSGGGLMRTRRGTRFVTEHLNHTESPVVLDGVNAIQNTGWRINEEVRAVLALLWEEGARMAGLPPQDIEALPGKPVGMDDDPALLKAWKKEASVVYQRNAESVGHRMVVQRVLNIAGLLEDKTFYYPQKLCFRGRIYPVPAFLQNQGNDVAKGLLEFNEGKEVTLGSDGHYWLSLHAANVFGDDKLSLWDRMRWAEMHRQAIIDSAAAPLINRWWADADKPWQFLAVCLELAKIWKHGKVNSRQAVALDGSNNGLQIFSLMLRDPIGGAATNCTGGPSPRDIYQDVADLTTKRLRLRPEKWAKAWVARFPDGLPRKAVKRAVMTMPYGAKAITCRDYLRDWFRSLPGERDEVLSSSVFHVADEVWQAITDSVPLARKAMDWLQGVADVASRAGLPIVWTTPINLMVGQLYHNKKTEVIRTILSGNVRRKMSYATDGPNVDLRKMKDAISPNLIHSLDASAMYLTIKGCRDRGVTHFSMIHDSFATHAANTQVMYEEVRTAYAALFEGDFLSEWREQILRQLPEGTELPPAPTQGTMKPEAVRTSDYFFL